MNTTTMRTMIAAAALMVAAGSASAQTFKAEIPMAFRVSNKTMAPGSYDLRLTRGVAGMMLVVYNRTTRSSAALVPSVTADPPKAWRAAGDAKIAFVCSDGACSLRELWDGFGTDAYRFPAARSAGTLVAQRSEFVTLSMVRTR